MIRVATISADDPELGEVIGSAFAAVGKNGVVKPGQTTSPAWSWS